MGWGGHDERRVPVARGKGWKVGGGLREGPEPITAHGGGGELWTKRLSAQDLCVPFGPGTSYGRGA